MLYQCDLDLEMNLFMGEYSSALSSDDLHDHELPLLKMRAKGGTMALWKQKHDQYVTPIPSPSSSFLPIVFSPPDHPPSIHLALYLPTAGQDTDFIDEIVNLNQCLLELSQQYPDAHLFLRGDANVNPKDKNRTTIFNKFCEDWQLTAPSIDHPTYHHFQGFGASDSQLDVILHSRNVSEKLLKIHCKLGNPLVTSHHDILLSIFCLPLSKRSS